MTHWLEHGVAALLALLSIPQYGLGAVFLIAFVSATLLPMGSEPAVFGLVKLRPDLFWQAMAVATLGNTLGGTVTWWMGRAVHSAADSWQAHHHREPTGKKSAHRAALRWLERFGAPACLLSWLPVVGDPLCAVAGWLRLPFWPCVAYMAVGKFGRYLMMTLVMQWVIT
ncbi:MAG: DedA family protein [Burkholderiales bacterium]|nr:DedA family protein [Burkholderiales bacterium]MDE2432432.1 DedA family protein [Burkholderiales bacterium]